MSQTFEIQDDISDDEEEKKEKLISFKNNTEENKLIDYEKNDLDLKKRQRPGRLENRKLINNK